MDKEIGVLVHSLCGRLFVFAPIVVFLVRIHWWIDFEVVGRGLSHQWPEPNV
jgi:hypothetical protein